MLAKWNHESHKIIIVFESYHHYNTEKIARVIAQVLQAELFKPDQVNISNLSDFNIIGIGTGIYFGKPHEKIQQFLTQLPFLKNKRAFLFTTSGTLKDDYTQNIREQIEWKGLQLIDCFFCKGFDNYGPLKFLGGINKGHPDLKDLYNAEKFANNLINRL